MFLIMEFFYWTTIIYWRSNSNITAPFKGIMLTKGKQREKTSNVKAQVVARHKFPLKDIMRATTIMLSWILNLTSYSSPNIVPIYFRYIQNIRIIIGFGITICYYHTFSIKFTMFSWLICWIKFKQYISTQKQFHYWLWWWWWWWS